MMTINADTKISALLKYNQDALETIVGISPKFVKLRNPILRKLMAGRTNIATACRIGGCSMNDFFSRLEPLGFTIDKGGVEPKPQTTPVPEFIINSNKENLVELDVRPIIESGKDPLTIILSKVKQLQQDQVLLIINSFEPTPLMQLLGKQGFESFSEVIHDHGAPAKCHDMGDGKCIRMEIMTGYFICMYHEKDRCHQESKRSIDIKWQHHFM